MLAISMSVAIIVVGNFMRNSVDEVIQTQFYDVQRYDLSLATVEPVSIDAVHELANMPGVRAMRAAAVCCRLRLRARNHSRRVGIMRLAAGCLADAAEDKTGHFVDLPREGLVISKKLAQVLHVKRGRHCSSRSAAGQAAGRGCADRRACSTIFPVSTPTWISRRSTGLMREGPLISGAMLTTDPLYLPAIYRRLKETPHVASVTDPASVGRQLSQHGGQEHDAHADDQSARLPSSLRWELSTMEPGFRSPSGAANWRRCG